jgi:hypothetical protein
MNKLYPSPEATPGTHGRPAQPARPLPQAKGARIGSPAIAAAVLYVKPL